MKKLLVVSLAISLMTVACTKARDPHFAQGQGENLLKISEYDGKTFEIQTEGPIANQQQSFSKASSIDIKAKQLGADTFSVVNYTVQDPLGKKLLGSTAIVGKPNTKYGGLIRVTQTHLKVYKVADRKDIPLSETTYAEKLKDDKLAVPLVGYPLTSRVTIERQKNEVQEETSTIIEKSQDTIEKSSHFKIDFSKPELFEAVVKTDLLPVSYFSGEWYYSQTITAAPEEDATVIGFGGNPDSDLESATRIKFMPDQDELTAVNVNLDERLAKRNEGIEYKATLNIPIEWKAYKISDNGRGMSEQEDTKLHWSKRDFLQISFGGANSGEGKSSGRLVALEVTDNYLSFTIEKKEARMRVKYAFLRVPTSSTYVSKRYFQDDKKVFGFFYTEKAVVNNFEISRKEDVDKNIFISRFNPNQKEIIFHFSKTTPQWIRPAVKTAVGYWNQAFQEAGTGMTVALGEEDVELGDLRYNTINIIESLSAANLFGFGPSIIDPKSGEIVSATTNVHLTPIREQIISEIRSFIAMKQGLLNEGKIAGVASQLNLLSKSIETAEAPVVSTKSKVASKMSVSNSKSQNFEPAISYYAADQKNPNKLVKTTLKKHTKHNCSADVSIASGNLFHEIEVQCPEVMEYVKSLPKGTYHSDKEVDIVRNCSQKMVVAKFSGTLVHELGHNFGLRHNFMGSNDVANFWPVEKTGQKTQVRSSSVMEYPAFNEDRLVIPGPYDIAAIRFGYSDAIETNDKKILKLNTALSIAKNLESKNVSSRVYKYCTDEDVSLALDPMCDRHDSGVTPLEVVRNKIADYQASYQLLNFRRDGIWLPDASRLAYYRANAYFGPLARFYEEWRQGIARYLGQSEQYLERLDAEQYAAVIEKMKVDPQFAEFTKQYKPTADEIFKFFFNIMTMDNRYCVLRDSQSNAIDLFELESVRDQMFFNLKKSVRTCNEAQEFFSRKGQSVVSEIGYYLKTFRYDLSPDLVLEPLDVVGTIQDRATAAIFLTDHNSYSYDSAVRGFAPSFMDEPIYRNILTKYMISRVTTGISGEAISNLIGENVISPKERAEIKKISFKKFAQEKDLIGLTTESIISGMLIPGKEEASFARLVSVSGIITRNLTEDIQQNAQATAEIPGVGYFVVLNPEATDALRLVKTYNSTQALRKVSPVDQKLIKDLLAKVIATLPADKDLEKMTVGEFLQKMNEILILMDAESKTQPNAVKAMANVIPDLLQFVQLSEQLEKQKGDETTKEQALAFEKAPLSSLFKGDLSGVDLTKEKAPLRIAKINDIYKKYQDNRVEIDAQLDILTKILIGLGNL